MCLLEDEKSRVRVAAWNGGVAAWRTGRDELGFSLLEEEKSAWTRTDDG
jgi:hypothetical protein